MPTGLTRYDAGGNAYINHRRHMSFTTPAQPVIANVTFQPIPGALTGTEQMNWTSNVPLLQRSAMAVGGSRQTSWIDYDYHI